MSLRDQLVAKGLASKSDKQRVQRELKKKRRDEAGRREKKSKVLAEQRAAEEAAREAAVLAKAVERAKREAEREQLERRERVRQTVRDNQVRARGSVVFHFKKLNSNRIGRLQTSESVARRLRAGEAGIAALPPPLGRESEEEDYHVVGIKAVRKLEEVAPEFLVFYVSDTTGISSPEERFLEQEWEISFTPRRVDG